MKDKNDPADRPASDVAFTPAVKAAQETARLPEELCTDGARGPGLGNGRSRRT